MTAQDRDDLNLQRYLAAACHEQVTAVASTLARELLWRMHPAATAAATCARLLHLTRTTPRAEPFARPS